MNGEIETLSHLIQWGEAQPLVRAMILTSTRAIPNAVSDVLSDYDVILIMSDIRLFFEDRTWLGAFGPVLAAYRDPLLSQYDCLTSAYVTQYETGLKIDFTLWPVEVLQRVVADPQLPAELDAGYRVLLDKDGLAHGLKPPSYAAYIPARPSESEYQAVVENFFLDSGYAAKFLWRDNLMAAKYILDYTMKQEQLRPMLEWHVEIEHGWSVKPGPYGRHMKKRLRPDLWTELEGCYTGADLEANWAALFKLITLFHTAANEVGAALGYAYPHDLERRAVAYLQKVKALEPGA
jgi:aminoglycoside 6-adenylyltransferase